MKKTVAAFLCGILVMLSVNAFAARNIFDIAKFPILLNGKAFTSDKPAIVINGTTYLPLKTIGEALNQNVNWDECRNQVEIDTKTIVYQNTYGLSPEVFNLAVRRYKTFFRKLDVNHKGILEDEDFDRIIQRIINTYKISDEKQIKKVKDFITYMRDTWFGGNDPTVKCTEEWYVNHHLKLAYTENTSKNQIESNDKVNSISFLMADKNGDNLVNLEEWTKWVLCFGLNEKEAKFGFSSIDKDKDGKITGEVFDQGSNEYFSGNTENIKNDIPSEYNNYFGPLDY